MQRSLCWMFLENMRKVRVKMKIPIDKIIVNERLRQVDFVKVKEIAESIQEIGLINPITITKDNILVAGNHRLEAYKQLKRIEIECNVVEFSKELYVELAEIDENLMRNELHYIDESKHLKRRKEIYEELHPETRVGQFGNKGGKILEKTESDFSTPSFVKDTSVKTGQSETVIKEKLQIANNILPEVQDIIKQKEVTKTDALKIARMEPEEQKRVAEKIESGAKDVTKATKEIKQEERKETLETKAKELPAEKFQVIYCDPPWQYNNSGLNGSAESKYPTIPIEELCNLDVRKITADEAVIFMWATNPLLKDAFQLMKAWGFEYKTNFVWVKEKSNFGKLGFYIYGQHELLLIGVKGSMLPTGDKPKSIITGENNIHSKKPETVYETIETMYPNLKYVELFARNTPREGWLKWGNEVGKYE
jgi:N6-adenosine-specific RNA methylase IME4